jgi:hypothetical protein
MRYRRYAIVAALALALAASAPASAAEDRLTWAVV